MSNEWITSRGPGGDEFTWWSILRSDESSLRIGLTKNGIWVAEMPDLSVVPVDSTNLIALFVVLEHDFSEVEALARSIVPHLRSLEPTLESVVVAALRSMDPYWQEKALLWVESGAVTQAIKEQLILTASDGVTQRIRHLALRLSKVSVPD